MRSPWKSAVLSQVLLLSMGFGWVSTPAQSAENVANSGVIRVAEKLPNEPIGASAVVSRNQVAQLVESFRSIAQQSTTMKSTTLYSEWRVSKQNIGPWTQQCLSAETTPEEFDSNPGTASKVVTCVIGRVFNTEYKNTDRDEVLAVRRTAAWWMTGDTSRYNSPGTAAYTQRVLDAYQSRSSIASAPRAENPNKPIAKPASQPADQPEKSKPAIVKSTKTPEKKPISKPSGPSTDKVKPVAAGRSTPYDRYMKAGYDAEKAQQPTTALTFFNRALDERPGDTYATTAIQTLESKPVVSPTTQLPVKASAKPTPSSKGSVIVPTQYPSRAF